LPQRESRSYQTSRFAARAGQRLSLSRSPCRISLKVNLHILEHEKANKKIKKKKKADAEAQEKVICALEIFADKIKMLKLFY
jgi:hypothetical protein